MNQKKFILFSIILIFTLSTVLMLRQLLTAGCFSSFIADTFVYTNRASQFVEALKEGIFYPRWMYLDFWGYGSPAFIVDKPLPYYLVAFINIFTGSIVGAMNIAKFIGFSFSGIGMFYLVKEFYSEKVALLTAVFYLVFPYNIFQLYFVGTFGSTISFMWFAPILLYAYRYMNGGHLRNILYAGSCYGGLILTHLINAYMFTFVFVLFIVFMSLAKKKLKGLILIPSVTIIGILISSAYFFPLTFERSFLNIEAFIGKGYGWPFYYFLVLPKVTSELPPNHFWSAYYNTFVFYIMFFCIFIIWNFINAIKLRRIRTADDINHVNAILLGITIGSLIFLFGISRFIWEMIPFFKYIQFPTRWLNITSFAIVFLSSSIFYVMYQAESAKRRQYIFIAMIFLAFLFLDYKYISSANIFTEQELKSVKHIDWIMSTLPKGVDIDKIDKNNGIKNKVTIREGDGEIQILSWKSAERIIDITAHEELALRIRTFYFPGWKAYVDNMQVRVQAERGSGAMIVDIPQGKHKLALHFKDTPIRYYSKLISLSSFLVTILLIIVSRKYDHKKPQNNF